MYVEEKTSRGPIVPIWIESYVEFTNGDYANPNFYVNQLVDEKPRDPTLDKPWKLQEKKV